jgi:hypothetical protein
MASNESRSGSPAPSGEADGRTVVEAPLADRIFLFVGIPAVVVILGLSLPPLARWALDWETALPIRPVFRLVGAIDRPWEIVVNLAIWLVLAFALAFAAMTDSMKLAVTDATIEVDKANRKRTVSRADVAAVFLDGKNLVVLDRESHQLIRDVHTASRSTLADAFRQHGYPWQDEDPYAPLYRSWTAATSDLPPAVNDVLAAREAALKKKAHKEAQDLSNAVEKLGYVVRDEGTRQFTRPLVRS